MTAAAIEATDLYRFYHAGDDETLALRGVSIAAAAGEIVAVLGPSGSGKSTLMACLAGLDEPDGGSVRVGGSRMTRRPEGERDALRAKSIGILLQFGNLIDGLTVRDNMRLQLRLAGIAGDERIVPALQSVGLGTRADSRPNQLSGGEAARAALALVLAHDPLVLLADEPTGNVDAATEQIVLDVLRARARAGGAAILATHSAAVAAIAHRVVHLRDGRIAGV